MVKKKFLPRVCKCVKDFILDEDSKVIDKSAIKVAVYGTIYLVAILKAMGSVHGGFFGGDDHDDYEEHHNYVNAGTNFGTGIHAGTNPLEETVNQIPKKTVETIHNNHYNHIDDSGGNGTPIVGEIGYKFLGIGHKPDGDGVDSKVPHHIPEAILRYLKDEEED